MESNQSLRVNYDLSENVIYNNSLFPAYIKKGTLSLFPDYAAASHWHEGLEFIVILDGTMTYNVNGKLSELTAGNGIFVNSRQLHAGFSKKRQECCFLCIILHPSLLCANDYFAAKYVEPFIWNTECPFILLDQNVSWELEILNLLRDIFFTLDEELAVYIIQRNFFRIMELLYENYKPKALKKGKPDVKLDTLKKMILFIRKSYGQKITLMDISNAGLCCKSKCSSLFKEYLKESPVVFLNKYRLKVSCELLRDTELSITEIAFSCGYQGSSYYCETFRKHYGMTPLQYKERQRESVSFRQQAGRAMGMRGDGVL